jgi:cell division transport system ATP-binding protein
VSGAPALREAGDRPPTATQISPGAHSGGPAGPGYAARTVGLRFTYPGSARPALTDLDASFPHGVSLLTGPSGAGKSTLLRLLLMKERPNEGEIIVNGHNLANLSRAEIQEYRRGIGFVFQDFKLIQRRTVLENISFVSEVIGVSPAQQRRRAFQVLKWVGLQHRMNAYPQELSGGEQQRISIARALMNDPALLLADEPTGNLDPDLSLEIMNLFREINAGGTTVLIATHDRELIRLVGRRSITLDQGRIVEVAEGMRA